MLTFVISAWISIGRNLPFDIYPFGLTLIDVLVIGWVFKLFISRGTLRADYVVKLMSIVIFCTALSSSLNSYRYGADWEEFFEVFRYVVLTMLYYFLLETVKDIRAAIYGFTLGNLTTFAVAYQFPMNPDVLGFVQIFNPNVIGNILSVNGMLLLILYARNPSFLTTFLSLIVFICTIFTYSKGAWLMSSLNMLCLLILLSRRVVVVKDIKSTLAFSLVALGGSFLIYMNLEDLSTLVISKIIATDFQASAAEGGSFSARVGLAYSGLLQWATNPLFGVGISNFELLNRKLEVDLGNMFYDDDNPNNVYIYILSGSGLFAFVAWVLLVIRFIQIYSHAVRRLTRSGFIVSLLSFNAIAIILISGSTQNEMLNGYYFWFILAIATVASRKQVPN
jgi:O-antigen ligase